MILLNVLSCHGLGDAQYPERQPVRSRPSGTATQIRRSRILPRGSSGTTAGTPSIILILHIQHSVVTARTCSRFFQTANSTALQDAWRSKQDEPRTCVHCSNTAAIRLRRHRIVLYDHQGAIAQRTGKQVTVSGQDQLHSWCHSLPDISNNFPGTHIDRYRPISQPAFSPWSSLQRS
jgi:hypothetical protein